MGISFGDDWGFQLTRTPSMFDNLISFSTWSTFGDKIGDWVEPNIEGATDAEISDFLLGASEFDGGTAGTYSGELGVPYEL